MVAVSRARIPSARTRRTTPRGNSHGETRLASRNFLYYWHYGYPTGVPASICRRIVSQMRTQETGLGVLNHALIIRRSAESVYNISIPKNSWTSQTMLSAPRARGCFPKEKSVNLCNSGRLPRAFAKNVRGMSHATRRRVLIYRYSLHR